MIRGHSQHNQFYLNIINILQHPEKIICSCVVTCCLHILARAKISEIASWLELDVRVGFLPENDVIDKAIIGKK